MLDRPRFSVQLTADVDATLRGRARAAYRVAHFHERVPARSEFVANAIQAEITRIEARYNNGDPQNLRCRTSPQGVPPSGETPRRMSIMWWRVRRSGSSLCPPSKHPPLDRPTAGPSCWGREAGLSGSDATPARDAYPRCLFPAHGHPITFLSVNIRQN